MPTVRLPIGRDEIAFELPLPLQETHIEEGHVKRRTADEALEHCTGSPRLEELSEGVSKIAVVVPDATRAWQRVPLMAEPVRRLLERCGVERVDWVIGEDSTGCPRTRRSSSYWVPLPALTIASCLTTPLRLPLWAKKRRPERPSSFTLPSRTRSSSWF